MQELANLTMHLLRFTLSYDVHVVDDKAMLFFPLVQATLEGILSSCRQAGLRQPAMSTTATCNWLDEPIQAWQPQRLLQTTHHNSGNS